MSKRVFKSRLKPCGILPSWKLIGVLCVLIGMTRVVQGQSRFKCEDDYQAAQEHYLEGQFDTAIRALRNCVEREVLFKEEARNIYRLIVLTFLSKEDPQRAEGAVKSLLAIDPSYEADPVQDPPSYATLVAMVKNQNESEPAGTVRPTALEQATPVDLSPETISVEIEDQPVTTNRTVWWSRPRNVFVAIGGMAAVSAALGLVLGGNSSPPPSGQ